MNVKEFMRAYRAVTKTVGFEHPLFEYRSDTMVMRPRIVCNDGFSISVQASVNHYCSPRENLFDEDYEEVELGFPSAADILINDYAEDMEDPTQTVYPWVPIEIVEELIEKHGGIKGFDTEQAERMKKQYVSTPHREAYVTW